MIVRTCCPDCGSTKSKKNGHIHNGKQNHRCKQCGRQFVQNLDKKNILESEKTLIEKSLLERMPLRGICRVFDVSLTWLLGFIVNLYENTPDHLNILPICSGKGVIIQALEAEIDEAWSFVQNKDNKQWIWIALDSQTKQVIAFYVGDRSKESAKVLWDRIPELYKENAHFYTDLYDSYEGVIPKSRHHAVPKQAGKTNHVERFNGIMRGRISRLVRDSLSFSKKVKNHIGAIKFFICNYNLEKAAALHV